MIKINILGDHEIDTSKTAADLLYEIRERDKAKEKTSREKYLEQYATMSIVLKN